MWKVIIALLISNVIGNLSYRNLGLFQYRTDEAPYSVVNIAKLLLNFTVTVGVATIIFLLMKKIIGKRKNE